MKKLAKREDQSVEEYELELWGRVETKGKGYSQRDGRRLTPQTGGQALREGFEMLDMED